MSKRNKKTYAWKTQRDFTTLFIEDMHKIIESLWDILNYFSTRVVQSIDQCFLQYVIKIVRPIPEEVLRVIADLRRLLERSRDVERACERGGTADEPVAHVGRLVHVENFKDELRESCRRFRRNCELLHENSIMSARLFGASQHRVNEFQSPPSPPTPQTPSTLVATSAAMLPTQNGAATSSTASLFAHQLAAATKIQ